jgi:hypothetical protein
VAFCGVIALAGLLTPLPARAASDPFTYSGVVSSGIFEGIDGYIRASTTTAIDEPDHRADWINLCTDNCATWVQIGAIQGYASDAGYTIYSPTAEDMFIENQSPCYYFNADFGTPPTPDYPYYIAYDGHRTVDVCGHTVYEYAFKKGSWSSSPVGYGYLPSYAGQPFSREELEWVSGSQPPSGSDKFGCDPSFNASSSYGIHLTNNEGSTWPLWTAAEDPSATGFADSNMTYSKATWWVFWAS